MPEKRMVKRVHKWKPMLTRPLRRPKNRWKDDIINYVKKLKIKNWTSCIICVEQEKNTRHIKKIWKGKTRSDITRLGSVRTRIS